MILTLEKVNTFYGRSHILQGISLELGEGELVLLIGRNGVGKTTTLKTIMGVQPPSSGKILFNEEEITGLRPHKIARRGIAYVPEERRIIPNLTVFENLKLGMLIRGKLTRDEINETIDEVFGYFPRLRERIHHRGDNLSGGEQQMLAIARGMVSKPKLILIDEPTEGLMPIMVEEIAEILRRLLKIGVTVLLVEQNYDMAFNLSEKARVYIMEKGSICYHAPVSEIIDNREPLEKFCGVNL
jgi:branched-chain amino acid transport system ATP-binding protein